MDYYTHGNTTTLPKKSGDVLSILSGTPSSLYTFFGLCLKPKAEKWHIVVSNPCLPQIVLPCFRVFFALYIFTVYAVFLYTTEVDMKIFFFYLTNIGYILLFIYFAFAGLHSIFYVALHHRLDYYLDQTLFVPSHYWAMIQFFYTMNLPIHFIVTIFYWTCIYSRFLEEVEKGALEPLGPIEMWVNVSVHGGTCFMLLIEFCLNQQKLYLIYSIPLLVFSGIYLGLLALVSVLFSKPDKTIYIYPFLKYDDPSHIGMHFAVIGAAFCIFLFWYFAHYIKYAILPPRLSDRNRSKNDTSDDVDMNQCYSPQARKQHCLVDYESGVSTVEKLRYPSLPEEPRTINRGYDASSYQRDSY